MMRSKQFSKNSAKRALLVNSLFIITLITGCSSPPQSNYLKKDIPKVIKTIAKKELAIEITCRMVDKTLWIYWPVDNLLEQLKKPQKYTEKFTLEEDQCEFKRGTFLITYKIAAITPVEKTQSYGYNKDVLEKVNQLWNVVRRVVFSIDRKKSIEPEYVVLVVADIKNGFEVKGTCSFLDLKKVSYGFISSEEYQHRSLLESSEFMPWIIGDKTGSYLQYRNLTAEDFICRQIEYRIRLKFQKPEVDKNADIDKEIEKIVANTLKIYKFEDFNAVELNNLADKNKSTLNQPAILDKPTQ